MSTVKERLLQFLKEEGISSSEFSRKMGLSPTYIASMRKAMPVEKVEKLTEIFPQINRDWLLYGEGEMYRDLGSDKINPHRLDRNLIPLVPLQARAGSLDIYVNGVLEEDCNRIYSPVRGADLAIRVMGDSMEPNIHNGTILIVQKINEKAFIPWGSPLVLDTQNGSLVKLLYPSEKGEDYLECRSYNPAYPPYQIPTDSIIGISRIMYHMIEGVTF